MAKKIIIQISDQMEAQLEKIQEENGFFTRAETVRTCLSEGIRKMNPAYIEVRKAQIRNKQSPEERAKSIVEAKELREQAKFASLMQEKENICAVLGGTTEDINGHLHCRYNIYTESAGKMVDSTTMLEPFDNLNSESIRLQYRDIFGNTGPEVKTKLQSYGN